MRLRSGGRIRSGPDPGIPPDPLDGKSQRTGTRRVCRPGWPPSRTG